MKVRTRFVTAHGGSRGRKNARSVARSIVSCSAIVGACTLAAAASPAAASPNQGVTATTIKVGVPYVDLQAVDAQFGLHLNQGSFPDAYNALIANLNAHGGIEGRKVVPIFVAVNPTGTTAAQSSCTQLTEDDDVFVAIAPLSPICYLEAGTPTISSTVQGTVTPGSAQNFTVTPPASAYDPLQLSVFTQRGVFKGKKVGIFGGETTDEDEVNVVQAALKKDHVDVVETGIDSAPATDQVSASQEEQVIAERFKSAGVNEVVAVGTGSSSWAQYQQTNQSTYNPPWVATSYADLDGYVDGKSLDPVYVKNVLSSSATPSQTASWSEPQMQQCVRIIKKAYPSDAIASPIGLSSSAPTTYVAPEAACEDFTLFVDIAKAAGKKLTTKTFTRAGYGLRNVSIPGAGSVSFGSGRAYALGTVYLAKYNPSTKLMDLAASPVKT